MLAEKNSVKKILQDIDAVINRITPGNAGAIERLIIWEIWLDRVIQEQLSDTVAADGCRPYLYTSWHGVTIIETSQPIVQVIFRRGLGLQNGL